MGRIIGFVASNNDSGITTRAIISKLLVSQQESQITFIVFTGASIDISNI